MKNFYGKLTINNVIYSDSQLDEWTIEGEILEPSGTLWIDSVQVGDNIYIDNIMFYGYLGKYKIISISEEFTSWTNFKATVKWDMPENEKIDPMPFMESIISSATPLGIPLEPEPTSTLTSASFLTSILNYEKSIVDRLITNNSGSNSGTNDYNNLINKPIFIDDISISGNELIINKSDGSSSKISLPTSSSDGVANVTSKILLNKECNELNEFNLLDSIMNFEFLWVNLSALKNGKKVFSQPMYLNTSTIEFGENEQFKYRADLGAFLTFTFSNENTLKITNINLVNLDSIQIDKILGIKFETNSSRQSILSFQKGLTKSLNSKLKLSIPYTMDFDFNKIHVEKFISNPNHNIKLNLNISNKEFNHKLISNSNNLTKIDKYNINIDLIDNTNSFIGKFKLNSNKNKKITIK